MDFIPKQLQKERIVTMDTIAKKALTLLREVKSVTFSTIHHGSPDARIADVMFMEDDGLYFTTARGKPYYTQLKEHQKIAICGMNAQYVTVRLLGDIRQCSDRKVVDKIFEQNPGMNELYPGEKRDILEGFHLYRGKGEIFDLSRVPASRERFAFGGESVNPPGYRITDQCTACGTCLPACPAGAVSEGDIYQIDGNHCLECGRCAEVCPVDAIEPAQGL
jgi:uncharacterized pyridoxamine 5'-phosphate oxidase family protein